MTTPKTPKTQPKKGFSPDGDKIELAERAVVEPKLLAEVIAFAGRSGAQSLYLEVRVSNTIARKFYADYGFVPTYLRKGYYENGEDALIMEREVEAESV